MTITEHDKLVLVISEEEYSHRVSSSLNRSARGGNITRCRSRRWTLLMETNYGPTNNGNRTDNEQTFDILEKTDKGQTEENGHMADNENTAEKKEYTCRINN